MRRIVKISVRILFKQTTSKESYGEAEQMEESGIYTPKRW